MLINNATSPAHMQPRFTWRTAKLLLFGLGNLSAPVRKQIRDDLYGLHNYTGLQTAVALPQQYSVPVPTHASCRSADSLCVLVTSH
jgi:hypothetical protein